MDENEKYHVTTGKIHGMNPPNSWDEVRPSEQKVAEHHWQIEDSVSRLLTSNYHRADA